MTSWSDYSNQKQGPNFKLIVALIALIVFIGGGLFAIFSSGEDTDEQTSSLGSIFTSTTSPAQRADEQLQQQLEGEGTTDEESRSSSTVEQLAQRYPQSESGLTPQRFEQARQASSRLITAYGLGVDRAAYGSYFAPGEPNWARDMTIDFVSASDVEGRPDLVRGLVAWHGTSYLGVAIEQMQQSVYFSSTVNGQLSPVPIYQLPEELRRSDAYLDGRWWRPDTTRPPR